ncbi:MAG TPA: Fic family protein [Streptosporangiaceae bacterium]
MLNRDHEDLPYSRPDATLGELRTAVLGGLWDQVAALCASITPTAGGERLLLDQLACQAALHARAARVLGGSGHPAPGLPGPVVGIEDAGCQFMRAMRRNFAALDGDRAQAAALLREAVPADCSPGPGSTSLPRLDVGFLNRSRPSGGPLRVIGVARPSAGGGFAIGDAGSPEAFPVAGGGGPVARGTPVEVMGRWDGDRRVFECKSFTTLGQVPDYPGVCAAVEDLCARAGFAAEPMQVRMVPSGQLDHSVVQARRRRRLGEWNAVLAAAELLEDALRSSQLSLESLARVHEIAVGASTARAGQLRQTPAVIRWCGAITYRAPPVEAARSQTRHYLRGLAAELRERGAARHPAALAAEAVACLTKSHPFADGNGRVARALATWLLLRFGFQRRTDGTLSTFLDAHLDEHYRTLRNFHVSPWGWHQLFYDAVLTTFERVSVPVGG